MSIDEVATIHETLIAHPLFEAAGDSDARYLSWVLPGTAIVIGFVLLYWRFWWRLPGPTRLRFLVAGGLFVSGALGMELAAGLFLAEGDQGLESIEYAVLTTVEECLEMLGIVVLIDALLSYMSTGGIAAVALSFEEE